MDEASQFIGEKHEGYWSGDASQFIGEKHEGYWSGGLCRAGDGAGGVAPGVLFLP